MGKSELYQEALSSTKTQALFVALTSVFGLSGLGRIGAAGLDGWAVLLLILSGTFLFYSLNYRTLVVSLTSDTLILRFGIFRWVVPAGNVADCRLDHLPAWARLGGAGIHFMLVGGRYRASFNFLEYPRLVIAFSNPFGPVRDISFSTRQPERLMQLILQTTAQLRSDK